MELLVFIIFGIILGTITGLIPGIHPNTLAALAFFIPFSPINVSIFLVSAAVTHTFMDFIPTIFLGAPNDDTSISVLPGHKMLLEGKGLEALSLTIFGGIGAIIFILLTIPIFTRLFPIVYEFIRPSMHIILAFLSMWMLKGSGKWGFSIFIMSGLLGYMILDVAHLGSKILFPLMTGLFGVSTLLLSSKDKIPKQLKNWSIDKKEFVIGGVLGAIAGMIVGMLPGIGSAQAAAAAREIANKSDRIFLVSSGAINTADSILSILALWLIGNPRSGIAVAIGNLMNIGFNEVLLIVFSVVIAASTAAILSIKTGKISSKIINKLNYRKISYFVISLIIVLVLIMTGFGGLLVLITASSIGIMCITKGCKRSLMMASLIVPTIIFFAIL